MPANFGAIEIYQGNGYTRAITVKENGVAKDISTWAIRFLAKAKATDLDAAAVVDKAATLVGGGTTGQALLTLTEAETDIDAGAYVAELRFTPTGGESLSARGRLVIVERGET